MEWVKLKHGFLRDEKIHFILKRYGHDAIVFWVGLISECSSQGILEIDEDIFTEILLIDPQRYQEIRSIFMRYNLVTLCDDKKLKVTNWEKYQYCQSYERVKRFRESGKQPIPREFKAYIYFIGADDYDYIKIGYSKNPWSRVKELQTSTTNQLRILATVVTTDMSEIDVANLFRSNRSKGEWYTKTDEISRTINYINSSSVVTANDVVNYVRQLRSNYVTIEREEDPDKDKRVDLRESSELDLKEHPSCQLSLETQRIEAPCSNGSRQCPKDIQPIAALSTGHLSLDTQRQPAILSLSKKLKTNPKTDTIRITRDWKITEEWLVAATSERPDLTHGQILISSNRLKFKRLGQLVSLAEWLAWIHSEDPNKQPARSANGGREIKPPQPPKYQNGQRVDRWT